MGKYREQQFNLAMGNISVEGEYVPIPLNHCITKDQRKAADTVYGNHAPDSIGGCAVAGWV